MKNSKAIASKRMERIVSKMWDLDEFFARREWNFIGVTPRMSEFFWRKCEAINGLVFKIERTKKRLTVRKRKPWLDKIVRFSHLFFK